MLPLQLLMQASAEDFETVFCFLDFQDTGESPNNKTNPVTEQRVSRHDVQSASENACKVNLSEACNRIP